MILPALHPRTDGGLDEWRSGSASLPSTEWPRSSLQPEVESPDPGIAVPGQTGAGRQSELEKS